MPRTCTVCTHAQVSAIDEALLQNEPYRSVAKRFGASESALYRQQQDHLPAALVKAKDAAEVADAGSLMDKIGQVEKEARRLDKKLEDAGGGHGGILRTPHRGVVGEDRGGHKDLAGNHDPGRVYERLRPL
jgi:hypothetical protein